MGDRSQQACAYLRLDHCRKHHHSLLTKQSIGLVTLESWVQVSSIPLPSQPLKHHPHPQVLRGGSQASNLCLLCFDTSLSRPCQQAL